MTELAFPGLIRPFSSEVLFGQRVGIVGRNGTGKSQFVRLRSGEAIEHVGEWMLGARVRVGYFSQVHETPHLYGKRPLEILQREGLDRTAATSSTGPLMCLSKSSPAASRHASRS